MGEFIRKVFGDDHQDRTDVFDAQIDIINKKYADYFESRPPKYLDKDKHDKAQNYYVTQHNGHASRIVIIDEALREDIKREIIHAYELCFKVEK